MANVENAGSFPEKESNSLRSNLFIDIFVTKKSPPKYAGRNFLLASRIVRKKNNRCYLEMHGRVNFTSAMPKRIGD